jgi:uncharacterized protein (TIGR02246 family)
VSRGFVEVVEGIRATIAAHAQAQDDGRTDDMVALYTPDGVVEIPGMAALEGADALRAAFDEWKPQLPQRHIVTNTVVTEFSDEQAKATSDVVFVQRGESGWAVQMVARYHDTFQHTDGVWLLRRRTDEFFT